MRDVQSTLFLLVYAVCSAQTASAQGGFLSREAQSAVKAYEEEVQEIEEDVASARGKWSKSMKTSLSRAMRGGAADDLVEVNRIQGAMGKVDGGWPSYATEAHSEFVSGWSFGSRSALRCQSAYLQAVNDAIAELGKARADLGEGLRRAEAKALSGGMRRDLKEANEIHEFLEEGRFQIVTTPPGWEVFSPRDVVECGMLGAWVPTGPSVPVKVRWRNETNHTLTSSWLRPDGVEHSEAIWTLYPHSQSVIGNTYTGHLHIRRDAEGELLFAIMTGSVDAVVVVEEIDTKTGAFRISIDAFDVPIDLHQSVLPWPMGVKGVQAVRADLDAECLRMSAIRDLKRNALALHLDSERRVAMRRGAIAMANRIQSVIGKLMLSEQLSITAPETLGITSRRALRLMEEYLQSFEVSVELRLKLVSRLEKILRRVMVDGGEDALGTANRVLKTIHVIERGQRLCEG